MRGFRLGIEIFPKPLGVRETADLDDNSLCFFH